MTITIKELSRSGSSITHKYVHTFVAWTDNPTAQGPAEITLAFDSDADLPSRGHRYYSPNKKVSISEEAYCTDIRADWLSPAEAEKVAPNAPPNYHVYLVTAEFEPLGTWRWDYDAKPDTTGGTQKGGVIPSNGQGNRPDKLVQDPHKWPQQYRMSFARRSIDRLQGQFKGKFKQTANNKYPAATWDAPGGNAPFANVNEWTALQNTAGIQFDPPFTGTEADLIMRIRNYSIGVRNFQGVSTFTLNPAVMFEKYVGRINSAAIAQLDIAGGIGNFNATTPVTHIWPAFSLKLESLQSELKFINGYWCYENQWEFHYREGLEYSDASGGRGWIENFPDISRYQKNSDTSTDQPCMVPIEVNGVPVYDPVRLDGNGAPILQGGSATCNDVWWLSFLAEKTADFNKFGEQGKAHVLTWNQDTGEDPNVVPDVAGGLP